MFRLINECCWWHSKEMFREATP